MQIKSFLLPIMMATTVSFVACSSSDDDKKDSMEEQAATTEVVEMAAKEEMKKEMVMPTSFETAETQLSYYIGFNVSSSIIASGSFTLDIEEAKLGLTDGADAKESKITPEQLQEADTILRAHFEKKAAAQTTEEGTEAPAEAEMTEEAPSEEFLAAEKQLSYYIGYNISSSVIASDSFAFDTASSLVGLTDGYEGKESQVTPEQLEAADAQLRKQFEEKQTAMQQEQQKAAMEVAEAAKADGVAFLKENGMKEGVMTTDSGLQYSVITKGDGTGASPTPAQSVEVHYHGTLIDGTVFDSSVDRGETISFPLNGVISGWTEGLQLMQVGDKFRFFIPSDLAYGTRATGSIPANSVLIFDVELFNINAE